jgi:hypothetical protein
MDRKSRVEPLDWKAPDSRLPRMIRIKQSFDAPILANVSRTVRAQLAQSGLPLRLDGLRIAVGVGSRGITNLQDIVITTVQWLKERGAAPFIVPAMGSHGGATAEGQAQVLAEFGITESCVGAPIVSSMDVVQLGAISSSIPVVMDKHAYEADGIVLINRIKSHTQFRSDIESGLLKLMVIGLGKDRMASIIHAHGIQGLVELLPQAARVVLAQGKILTGLAIVENAYKQTAEIRAIRPEAMEREEKELLTRAKELMPSLPVDQLDLLVLDEMGKEISGPGMDSSITGRIMAHRVPDPEKPDIKILAVLDLTAKSMGNAVGLGVADLTTERLVKKMNRQTTYVNTIVGGFPVQGKIPMFFATDRELLQAAAQLIGAVPFHQARVIRAKNTLMMTELLVSEALVQEVCRLDRVEVVGDPGEWEFDEHGWLRPSFDSKAKHAS